MPGIGLGIGKCPYDPADNSTAVYVENGNPFGLPALVSSAPESGSGIKVRIKEGTNKKKNVNCNKITKVKAQRSTRRREVGKVVFWDAQAGRKILKTEKTGQKGSNKAAEIKLEQGTHTHRA